MDAVTDAEIAEMERRNIDEARSRADLWGRRWADLADRIHNSLPVAVALRDELGDDYDPIPEHELARARAAARELTSAAYAIAGHYQREARRWADAATPAEATTA